MKAIISGLAFSMFIGSAAQASAFKRSGDPAASVYPTSSQVIESLRNGDSCPFKSGNEVQGALHDLSGNRLNYARGGNSNALAPAHGTD